MNLEEKKKFIFFRLQEAEESLSDAELLLQNASYRSSVNRSYYSMFYGILALINLTGVSISKHTGVISHFDKEFVKTGKFSKDSSKFLHSVKEVTYEEAEAIELLVY